MQIIIFLFSFLVFLNQSLATEIQVGTFGQGNNQIHYSYNYTEGSEAQWTAEGLKKIKQPAEEFSLHFEGHEVVVERFEFKASNDASANSLLDRIGQQFRKENPNLLSRPAMMKHITFVLVAAGSLTVWSMKAGIMPYQMFIGAGISVMINALFLYFEDYMDYKVYPNRYSKKVAQKVINPYRKLKERILPKIYIGYETLMQTMENLGLRQQVSNASSKKELAKSLHYTFENVKGNRAEKTFLEFVSPRPKENSSQDSKEKRQEVQRQTSERFATRFLSSLGINFMLAIANNLVVLGFPGTSTELVEFTMSIGLTLAAVTFIGQSYSLIRGSLKDLLLRGKVSQRFVRWYVSVTRVSLAIVAVALYSQAVSLGTLVMTIGVPGWVAAYLLASGKYEKIFSRYVKKNKKRVAEIYSNAMLKPQRLVSWYEGRYISDFNPLAHSFKMCRDIAK